MKSSRHQNQLKGSRMYRSITHSCTKYMYIMYRVDSQSMWHRSLQKYLGIHVKCTCICTCVWNYRIYVSMHTCIYTLVLYSKTSDNGHSNKRTTSLQWTNCLPPSISCPYISTSDEGTTSEQWTKCSSPPCPLFGGSTVYLPIGRLINYHSPVKFSFITNSLSSSTRSTVHVFCSTANTHSTVNPYDHVVMMS